MNVVTHRRDIQGLRAIAVLLVVLHHAWPNHLPGGYVGVDVFFVISGYLITLQLLSYRDFPIGHQLMTFYARRVRRILPMALLVILATTVMALLILGPVAGRDAARDGVWAALFAANVHEIRQQTDYFSSPEPSLLQHYWSLAVEEQFYLVWPVLFVAIMVLGRHYRVRLAALIGGLAVLGSFAVAVIQSETEPVSAYFSTVTRVWQIGAGVVLALMTTARASSALWRAGRVVAVAAVVAASLILQGGRFEPLVVAILVVVPTVALLASDDDPVVSRVLGSRVMHYVGDISFSWYLWHWPVLEISRRLYPEGSSVVVAAAVLVSLALAALSHHLWENPVRFRVQVRPPMAVTAGLASVGVAVLALSLPTPAPTVSAAPASTPTVTPLPSSPLVTPSGPTTTPETEPTASASDTTSATASPSPTSRPSRSPSPSAEPSTLEDFIDEAFALSEFPASTTPQAQNAGQDRAPWLVNGCSVDFSESTMKECLGGDSQGTKTMVVYGDSHASMWMTALDAIAKDRGYRIHLFAKLACPLPRDVIWSYQLNRPFTECVEWQEQVLTRIRELQPDVTIVTNQFKPAVVDGKKSDPTTADFWRRSFPRALAELKSISGRVILIGNNPSLTTDPIACATRPGATPLDCMASLTRAGNSQFNGIEQSAAEALGIRFVDTVAMACNPFACPIVINGIFAYFDQWHFTDTYVRWLRPRLEADLGPL